MKARTLLCLESPTRATQARWAALRKAGYIVVSTDAVSHALRVFVSQTIDAVLLDAKFGNGKKQSLAAQMSSIRPQVPIIGVCRDHQHHSVAVKSFTGIFCAKDGAPKLLQILEEVLGSSAKEHRIAL